MNTVSELLEDKGRKIWSIAATQSVYQAISMMAEMEVGALTVVDDDSQLIGIISERDYARKVILKNRASRDTAISEIMTREVTFVDEEATLETCMSLMTEAKIRHLPVIDGKTPIAMITVGDVLKVIIQEQNVAIEELESYIMDETGGSG